MSFLLVETTAILRQECLGVRPAREDGSLRFSSTVLSCLRKNCKFSFHFFLCRLGYFSKVGELQFGFHPYYRFPITFLHLKGIAGHLYPGPSLGVLTQESDTYEPRILRLEACWARRPSGRSLNRIDCATSILRTL